MGPTQDHLPIKDIRDDIVILKDGNLCLVLETSAVNFGLLSENEQLAIISAFAALLNSLSFSIQIVIRSKRLDITSYLNLLSQAENSQKNPLLKNLITSYRKFIETTVRENQVLDKEFYIIIGLSPLEVGITASADTQFKKALTILLPRRDHIIRQLWRTGLKASQLTTKQLISLYFDIYNPPKKPAYIAAPAVVEEAAPQETISAPAKQTPPETVPAKDIPPSKPVQETPRFSYLTPPFIVEELTDDYGTI